MSEQNGPGVWPGLKYDDAEAARVFLTEVFGFTETMTVRGEDGVSIAHGELRWPEGGGVMYGSMLDETGLPRPSAGSQWLYVVTADPDAVHRRAAEQGAKVLTEPTETDYGSRNVTIADPEGNVWTFGTYAGA
ncbi:VOC family protein [Amycolatopsis sp. 195334CR]|uniref:VOC family protein n=1 Tax=Amycolatopsis sp. 195334CR TaxID=2814588 RepID=UPI001A8D09A3|nr:VOC family protein [Amycolatopsis sp. 195334CR]MBN6033342.1 VOC family protein [Amycolatopsis sp. 195334CR]